MLGAAAPAPAFLWFDARRRAVAGEILGHPPRGARVRYWRAGARTAFVLDEVAHTHPITAGFAVERGRLVAARVLTYRESRGWEVQRPQFLAQFLDRGLDAGRALDGPIDGITGATLSVGALTRMARLALYLAAELDAEAARDGR